MKPEQEPKYDCNESGQIFSRASGKVIPDDEPIFILRAKDRWAIYALRQYQRALVNDEHIGAVRERIRAFVKFADANQDRMKEPDTATPPQPKESSSE